MKKELIGIEQIQSHEKQSSIGSVGWIWFGANIGMFSLILGAIERISDLTISQAIVVSVLACMVSFLIVGVISAIGAKSGLPTLTVSRKFFGTKGNFITALISWISILGWEVISTLIVTWCMGTFIKSVFHLNETSAVNEICLLVAIGISLLLAFYGFQLIARVQKVFSIIFGALTLISIGYLFFSNVRLGKGLNHTFSGASSSASFEMLVVVFGIVAASTGISWINLAGDFSRYLPKNTNGLKLTSVIVLSASVPCIVLIMAGYFLQGFHGSLANSINPVTSILSGVPKIIVDLLLIAGAGGMLLETDLASYSSGLNLLTMGVKIKRSRTVFIDLSVVFVACNIMLFGLTNDITTFENFLLLLADGLMPFAGIALADLYIVKKIEIMARRDKNSDIFVLGDLKSISDYGTLKTNFNFLGIVAWVIGVLVALSTTVCPFYSGFLAKGFLAQGNFGLYLGFLVSLVIYLSLDGINKKKELKSHNQSGKKLALKRADLSCTDKSKSELSEINKIKIPVTPKRLVLIGSVIVDILMYVDRFIVYGSDQMAKDNHISTGGGFNVLAAAKQTGLSCVLGGKVGSGFFGRQIARDLELYEIDIPLGFDKDNDSGFTVGIVDDSKVNTFVTYPGTESKLTVEDLKKIEFYDGDAVYISGYDLLYPKTGSAIMNFIRSLNIKVLTVVDSGPLLPKEINGEIYEFLKTTDIFTLNEAEAKLVTDVSDVMQSTELISRLLSYTGIAIVRMGSEGCCICQNGSSAVRIKTSSGIDAKDTVGAGDIHTGVLLAAISHEIDFIDSVEIANRYATQSISHKGGFDRGGALKAAEDLIETLKESNLSPE